MKATKAVATKVMATRAMATDVNRAVVCGILAVLLLLGGCTGKPVPAATPAVPPAATPAASPADEALRQQVAALQADKERLEAQLQRTETDFETLKTQIRAQPSPAPCQISVGVEKATAIALDTAHNSQVIASKLVEFNLRSSHQYIAVWALTMQNVGGSIPFSAVIDACTGDVLNVTSPHTGQ